MTRPAVVALAGLLLLLAAGPDAQAGVPAGLAKEARWVARHGGVQGSCHGCASPRLQQLVRRIVVKRFSRSRNSDAVRTALCIVRRESGFNPAAVSSTGDYGVPQMNRATWEYDKRGHPVHPEWWQPARGFRYLIFDPAYAVGAMYAMSKRGTDWGPWNGGTRRCF